MYSGWVASQSELSRNIHSLPSQKTANIIFADFRKKCNNRPIISLLWFTGAPTKPAFLTLKPNNPSAATQIVPPVVLETTNDVQKEFCHSHATPWRHKTRPSSGRHSGGGRAQDLYVQVPAGKYFPQTPGDLHKNIWKGRGLEHSRGCAKCPCHGAAAGVGAAFWTGSRVRY